MAAKKVTKVVKLQVLAGKATPAPPVGPALGQAGVNIMEFVKQFNDRTAQQVGLVIPVVISVYEDRSFTFITKTPPAPVLLKKAAGIETASGEPNKKKVAKAMVCDERYGRVDFDQWFDQVVTPDNITEIVTSKGVAAPVIYPSVSTFEGSAKVSLVSEDGDKIKYTTDGTSPVLGGTEYTAPFSISDTTTVKAVAVRGEETSAVVEKSFVKLS